MVFYHYFCEANGQVVEVRHSIATRLITWGEVCRLAERALGDTPAEAPVVRLMSGAMPFVPRLKGLDKDAPSAKLEV